MVMMGGDVKRRRAASSEQAKFSKGRRETEGPEMTRAVVPGIKYFNQKEKRVKGEI